MQFSTFAAYIMLLTASTAQARPSLRPSKLFRWGGSQDLPADDLYGALAGSTIEVVRTQATYFTRAAAFGPHVEDDLGLRGTLIPISDYYHPANLSPERTAMHACPEDAKLSSSVMWRVQGRSEQQTGLHKRTPPSDWIALVERGGNCPFVEKVRVAQSLGAIAVVVGDAPDKDWTHKPGSPEDTDPGQAGKRLLTMFANGDSSDIGIPSTFITRPSFLDLRRLISELKQQISLQSDEEREFGIEIVISKDDGLWEWPLVDLALILLLLPSLMTISTVILHRIRQARIRRRERAPQLVVQNLPCLVVRGNGQPWEKVEGKDAEVDGPSRPGEADAASTSANRLSHPAATTALAPESSNLLPPGRSWFYSDECAICLSNFVEGDRVRVLPCGHIFHKPEIDDWLLLQKKVCPVCKRDITVPVPSPLTGGTTDGTSDATNHRPSSEEGNTASPDEEGQGAPHTVDAGFQA